MTDSEHPARELTSDTELREALARARTVAVLGAHQDPSRPAHYVPAYLHAQGYRVLGVNPALAGQSLWGEAVRARLDELGEPVDLVDVFRRGELVASHVDEILAMKPLPSLVWMQLGVRSEEAARRLLAAGVDVVQD